MKKKLYIPLFIIVLLTATFLRAWWSEESIPIELHGRAYLTVYINETKVADSVLVNLDDADVQGPDILSDFVPPEPVANALQIQCLQEGETVTLQSEQYGTRELKPDQFTIKNGELYVEFSQFRVYTQGTLEQESYRSMTLYTPDFVRDDLPATLAECYTLLDGELSLWSKWQIKRMSRGELIELHFGPGLWMRNNWLRANGCGVTLVLAEKGYDNFDDMSYAIIRGYWLYLHKEPCTLEDVEQDIQTHQEEEFTE